MVRVKCRNCGKVYDYRKNEICPGCGAYNRPPRREVVDADGTVHIVQEKVCFEEKECHETAAQQVRESTGKTAWETDDLEVALHKGINTAKGWAAKLKTRKHPSTPQQKRLGIIVGVVTIIIALAGEFMDNRAVRRPEPAPELSIEADSESAVEIRYHDMGEEFEANGRRYAAVGNTMVGKEITVVLEGDSPAEDPWNVCLDWHDPDGAAYAIGPDEIESRGDRWIYEFDIEDFTDHGCGADKEGYFIAVYEYPDDDSVILHLISL